MEVIYTLRKAIRGERSAMNGKLCSIREAGDRNIYVSDATSGELLSCITSVSSCSRTDDGLLICTYDGDTYDLIDVSTLIPTSPNNIPIINIVGNSFRSPSASSDGFNEILFYADRDITKDELIEWLEANGYETNESSINQYNDYCVIVGKGKHWIYKKIYRYRL